MNKKRSAKKISIPHLIISIVIFALVVGIIVLVAVNINDLSFEAMGKTLKSWFGGDSQEIIIDYENMEPSSFAPLAEGIVAASDTGFVVFDKWGDKVTYRDVVMMQPTVVSNGNIAGIYDCGGNTLFIVDDDGNVESYETENKLVSVSVNDEGWFALCTEEENYKGSVTVLNDDAGEVYKLYSGDGYILSAELSSDSEMLLAAKLTSTGTDIVEYRLDSEIEQMRISLPSQVAVKCEYGGYGDISVLTDSGFYVYDSAGNEKKVNDFSAYQLKNFDIEDDGYSVIYWGAYEEDTRAFIVTLDDSGNEIARQEMAKTIVDISAAGQHIAVLYTDGLTVYDKNLKEYKTSEITSGMDHVVLCEDGTVFVTNEYSAEVLG